MQEAPAPNPEPQIAAEHRPQAQQNVQQPPQNIQIRIRVSAFIFAWLITTLPGIYANFLKIDVFLILYRIILFYIAVIYHYMIGLSPAIFVYHHDRQNAKTQNK